MNRFQLIQTEILKQIKSQLPEETKLVDELTTTLSISSDSAYRRIRLEKTFSLDEIIILCETYGLSLDVFTTTSAKENVIPFQFDFNNTNFNLDTYLDSLVTNVNRLKELKGTLFYSAKDVPIFYHFKFPSISKFKMLYWLKTMVDHTDYQNITFETFEQKKEWKEKAAYIFKEYSKLPSVEIWNYETTHSNIAQVVYYYNSGFINKENALLVLSELMQEIEYLRLATEQESKLSKENKNLTLFYNEVFAADNTILAKSNKQSFVFLPHIILNYMTTGNDRYCEYIHKVFQLVVKKSTLITGVNERDRNAFFNYNIKRMEKEMQKIKLSD